MTLSAHGKQREKWKPFSLLKLSQKQSCQVLLCMLIRLTKYSVLSVVLCKPSLHIYRKAKTRICNPVDYLNIFQNHKQLSFVLGINLPETLFTLTYISFYVVHCLFTEHPRYAQPWSQCLLGICKYKARSYTSLQFKQEVNKRVEKGRNRYVLCMRVSSVVQTRE